jgi:hypothetical protein
VMLMSGAKEESIRKTEMQKKIRRESGIQE